MHLKSLLVSLFTHCVAAGASIGGAMACDALNGTTTYDSKFAMVGDPFQGGNWSNAANGKAWIQRTLKAPVNLFGVYLGSGGSDITTDNVRIKVSARLTTGAWKTLVEVAGADVERPISGSGNMVAPVTVRFANIKVNALRVDMTGNGWFSLDRSMFFVEGCSGH